MHAYSFVLAKTELAHENRTTTENIFVNFIPPVHEVTHTQYTEAQTLK